MRTTLLTVAFALTLPLLAPAPGRADCPDACNVPGGGGAKTDCIVGFDLADAHPLEVDRNAVRCTDGQPCDADGGADGACGILVRTCLKNTIRAA